MSQFPARDIFRGFMRPRERGAEQEGHQDRAAEAGPHRGERRGFSAPAISEILLSRTNNGPQEEPIASSFPSVMRGLKPNPFGQQRLRLTNFPFGQSRIPREANSPPFAVLRCARALRVQAARAGLFYAAPRGTRWRWASGPGCQEKGSPQWLPTAPSPPPSVRPAS